MEILRRSGKVFKISKNLKMVQFLIFEKKNDNRWLKSERFLIDLSLHCNSLNFFMATSFIWLRLRFSLIFIFSFIVRLFIFFIFSAFRCFILSLFSKSSLIVRIDHKDKNAHKLTCRQISR